MPTNVSITPPADRTYLVFDTETTDLLPDVRHPDRNPRLLSLAWGLYDAWGRTVDEQYHLVRPVGFTIDETGGAFRKHRITQARAVREGRPRRAVLPPFVAALRGAHAIVAHNLAFDREIIRREVAPRERAAVADAPGWCTMEVADMADAPERNAPRWMHGLEHLYGWAFGEELRPPGGAHDARDDMRACARLFFAFRPSGYGMIGPETNRLERAPA